MNDDLDSLYAYTRWADSRAVHSLRQLSPEEYARELGGGWPSARATFVHLASATNAWAGRFSGRDVMVLHKEEELPALDDAAALLDGAHASLKQIIASMTPERAAAPFTWKNLKGEPKTAPFWSVLRHVVNHGTYHRGQISSMVRRLGHKPLATDMVIWGIEIHGGA